MVQLSLAARTGSIRDHLLHRCGYGNECAPQIAYKPQFLYSCALAYAITLASDTVNDGYDCAALITELLTTLPVFQLYCYSVTTVGSHSLSLSLPLVDHYAGKSIRYCIYISWIYGY